MKFEKRNLVGIIAGVLMIVGSLIFLRGEKLFWFVTVLSAIIIILPFIISVVIESGRKKEVESRFLEFVRDLVENVKSGTPISKSIINLKKREYGPLSPYVEKLANQISLGIPFTKSLITFADDIGSKVITRAVSLISEADRAGGNIGSILESVAKSVNQTEDLKKEQRSAVYNLIIQGYIIFIVFIIIMLVLQFQILPMTAGLGGDDFSDLSIRVRPLTPEQFSTPLFIMLLVQAFFAGLVIGKISEGSFKDGIKHSFILVALSLLISTGTGVIFG